MLRLIGVELFKLKKRWLLYALLIALLIFSVVPIITSYSSYQSLLNENPETGALTVTQTTDGGSDEIIIIDMGMGQNMREAQVESFRESFTLPGSMNGIFRSIAGMGPILVIVLAAAAIGSEYRWGTLRQMLIKGTGRAKYLGSKLIGIAIAIIAGVIIALLAGFITSLITTSLSGSGISWDFMSLDFIGYLFSSLGRILLILGVYFTLSGLFVILFRSVTTGMALGIVFIFADSILSALLFSSTGWLADIVPYTIGHNVQGLTRFSLSVTQDSSYWVEPTIILSVYCLVFLAAGFYAFHRQDITA